ncbi:MAG: hypothetical protein IKJ67_00520 [Bacteroidales bacterium]|nr:hypothetical protein [Bacteroidales bacterium]
MMLIYSTKPENKGGIFLLLFTVMGFIAAISFGSLLLECSKISDILIIILILFVVGAGLCYILDEAVWQMFGKEICECDDTKIIITRRRLFKRRKMILWNEITNISLYDTNNLQEIFFSFTLAGSFQNTIQLRYGNGKKYKCGANLSKIQAQNVIKLLKSKKQMISVGEK